MLILSSHRNHHKCDTFLEYQFLFLFQFLSDPFNNICFCYFFFLFSENVCHVNSKMRNLTLTLHINMQANSKKKDFQPTIDQCFRSMRTDGQKKWNVQKKKRTSTAKQINSVVMHGKRYNVRYSR